MARQLLLFLGMLAIGAGAVQAQPSQAISGAEDCRSAANETLQSLQTRKTNLEQDLKRFGHQTTPAVRKMQEDLLEVLFQIECLTGNEPVMAKRSVAKRSVTPAPSASKDVVEITTYYATNRNKLGGPEPVKMYGTNYQGNFQYGRAVVTIPPTHKPGEIETLNWIMRLIVEPDPKKQFTLKSVTPLELDQARKEMADKIKSSNSKSMLVFVHGYNSGFADAAMRTAQIAYDLKFPGMPFFYSWPSANRVRAYLPDEEAARLSESVFEALVDDLTTSLPVTDIYIVAHSMGTRVVSHALQHRVEKGKPGSQIRELLLAAPDINAELFRGVIAPKLAAMQGLRTTVYASSSDLALMASKVVHGFQRVGETTGGVFVYPGIETVDASSASSSSRALGHSYVVDTPSVIGDIKSVVLNRATTKQRGLTSTGTVPNIYWKFP
ncbi:MAG TPA: alpha/beta hydrolase [Hyphomicrobiaceae bacterium]|nr:alpha/beta hydrolase [Hyphomicrobiaceae bacterium]